MSDSTHSIVVLGAQGVGKTALVQQYLKGEFQQSTTSSSYNLTSRKVSRNIKLDVLEVSCGTRNSPVMKRAISQGSAFILVYSLADVRTFAALTNVYNAIISVRGEVPIHVVGNKADLVETDLPFSTAMEERLKRTSISTYFEVTSRNNEEVFDVFQTALESVSDTE